MPIRSCGSRALGEAAVDNPDTEAVAVKSEAGIVWDGLETLLSFERAPRSEVTGAELGTALERAD